MKNNKLTFEDFQLDTISRKEQKTIKGGSFEDPTDSTDPNRYKGGGNN
ncbi:MAG: rSAM-modified peptide [Flavobacterium sp.]|nr:rSAM-modified peptide [Flavobacterium sp.]MBO9583238.1 rSAM-modified peptide [Flavobacterium sp.]